MFTVYKKALEQSCSDSGEFINSLPELKKKIDMSRLFGRDVFSLKVMRERLPRDIYQELEQTSINAKTLSPAIADIVANAMKDWAVEHGATHYAHWFQPMTGLAAEKHDAFMTPTREGNVINEFSGKMLICGESDASSFPSGGIRSTFEARGYTAWDPTVPAFILEGPFGNTLYIPTFFYSYTGEVLDRKTPLLRSMNALSKQALRILRVFGNTSAAYVEPMVGAEQEYFLIDQNLVALRPDLKLCSRTLYGAKSPKGQELADHYYGAIPKRVMAFMQEVELRLAVLGIPVKTRHNEVAPGQFELAPIYESANIATDHNMLTMDILESVAKKYGFVCILNEKPFAGVNGSGKHNNWSLRDSDGHNLFSPGDTSWTNAQFLVFLAAVLRTAHLHSAVLRLGTSSACNDHRLGANEAPPAIISVFLGDLLTSVVESIILGRKDTKDTKNVAPNAIKIGVSVLPPLPADASDRNRTSPFAFTGNKFEFRAVGAPHSIAPINIVLNSAMACSLDDIATELENSLASGIPLAEAVETLLAKLFKEHLPVIFNGNNYSKEWVIEAEKRKLLNLKDSVEATEKYNDPAVTEVFIRQGVYTEREILARQEMMFERYIKTISIEANVASAMGRTMILPVTLGCQADLAKIINETRAALGAAVVTMPELNILESIREYNLRFMVALDNLDAARERLVHSTDILQKAHIARDIVVPAMKACRVEADALEEICDNAKWPMPKYAELLWTH